MSTATEIAATKLQRLALSADEVAATLGVSVRQIWRMASAGKLPKPRLIGCRRRWDRAELEQWWAEQPGGS